MSETLVTLGGQQYTIKPLPLRASREWRQRLAGPFTDLSNILTSADQIQLNSPSDVGRLIEIIKSRVLDSPDLAFGLLCDYSPAIAADRDRIEETATDPEVFEALIEVLRIVYPFGGLAKLFRGGRG